MAVVVGYAPTPEGEPALAAAGEEARRRGTPLVVVSSTRGESHVDPTYRPTSTLAHLTAALRSGGLAVEVREPQVDDPADAIVGTAEAVGAELVVIGLRRRSAVGKLLLGSTAQRVLMRAPCNVLAVRGGRA
jgi:nucleotide-binding universal stress UspA family protein